MTSRQKHDSPPEDRILRSELNYVRYPIFTLDRTKVGSKAPYKVTCPLDDKDKRKITGTLTVYPDPVNGIGGPFDYRAFRAIENILSERWRPNVPTEPVLEVTAYKIFAAMGLTPRDGKNPDGEEIIVGRKPTKNDYRDLRRFLERMERLRLHSDNAIEDRARGRGVYLGPNQMVPPIYEKVDFARGSRVTIVLGELYRTNLDHNGVKLFPQETYIKILRADALTRRLYELIAIRAYENRRQAYFTYDDLCQWLPFAGRTVSHVKQRFGKAFERLEEFKVLKAWENKIRVRHDGSKGKREFGGRITFHIDDRDTFQVPHLDKEDYEDRRRGDS